MESSVVHGHPSALKKVVNYGLTIDSAIQSFSDQAPGLARLGPWFVVWIVIYF